MNGAHLHLLVNHIPIFGVTFGLIAMCWSIFRKSSELRFAAITLFIIAGGFGWLAMETGESAEDLLKTLPEMTKDWIHNHEEAAEVSNILTTITALSAIALVTTLKLKSAYTQKIQILVLLFALLSSVAMARTAYLGGQIRHTEIRASHP